MKKKSIITVKSVKEFTPNAEAKTEVCISGNVTELKVTERVPKGFSNIKRLNKDEYVDKETGEVKRYQHHDKESSRNLNKIFEYLRRLVNTNFTGAINELHIVLTYAEEMTDFDKASTDFKRFWEKLRYHYKDIEYIRVIEPHHTGSWHIHVLIKSVNFKYLQIPYKQIEKLWGHGSIHVSKTTGCDNVGAYFTALCKNHSWNEETNEKNHSRKRERVHFYPSNKRIYSSSKGIQKPKIFHVTYEKAQQYVDQKNLVFSQTTEINLTYDTEEVKVNTIHRYQYNKKKNKKE